MMDEDRAGGDELRGSDDEVSSLPPVVPDEPERVNSLPPVVPDEPEVEHVNSSPPVVPEEPGVEHVNSLPPVVPEEPERVNSLPPVVPDKPEVEVEDTTSLPLAIPDEPELEHVNSLPPVVPDGPDEPEPDQPDQPEQASSLPAVVPDQPQADRVDTDLSRTDDDWGRVPHDVRVFVAPDDPATPAEGPAAPWGDPATPAAVPPATPSGWAILGRALTPRATRVQLVAGVLCAVLGFAVVAQVRQSDETSLVGMRQGDLVRILDETTSRGDALAREAADLTRERDDLLSGSDRRQAALDALRRSAETQGILAGRLPAEGPGVVVTLTESDGFIKPFTMLNLLEELRNAGAEAIQLNDQRITASSAFTGTGSVVALDGVELSTPYRWIAIGDPDIIAPALQIPGGAMAQVRNNGGKGTVDRLDLVQVDAVRTVPEPEYATPVPPKVD